MKKSVSFLLALVLFLLPLLACAESTIQPRAAYIVDPYASLSISGGVATYVGRARASSYDTTTHITVSLVRKADDSHFWLPVESWTASSSGISTAIISKSPAVESGYTYYSYTYVEVKDANGNVLETAGVRSAYIHY